MSDKAQRKKISELETESATSFGSTAKLEHWEPSGCSCPKCSSNNVIMNIIAYPELYSFKCRDCEYTWTGDKQKGIQPMRVWPNLEEEITITSASNSGWICPKCGSTYSPTTNECPRCAASWMPFVVTYNSSAIGEATTTSNSTSGGSNAATIERYNKWRD